MEQETAQEPKQSALQAAQERLADAAMGIPMNPQGAAMSAYVNGALQSARIDALVELWVSPPNATWSKAEAYEAALLGALSQRAEVLEAKAIEAKEQIEAASRKIEVASAMPGSVAAAVRNMTRN